MQKALLIAEKQSLMRIIKEIYDTITDLDYEITFISQAGHLVELMMPNEIDENRGAWSLDSLPFFPEDSGGWKYKIIVGKERLFNNIKQELNSGSYDFVIHAGDPDQEGQLLIQLVLNQCNNTLPVKRFWTNDLTPKAVETALKNLRDNDNDQFLINLYEAALFRQKVDYLYGMNFTEGISLKTQQLMSIGRVKIPVTKIIVDRENDINNYKPHYSYGVSALYDKGFKGFLYKDTEQLIYDLKTDAEDRISRLSSMGKVVSIKQDEKKTYAPSFFKLSTLQIAASKEYGYNADKVLSIVQGLYEQKLLTYPRTSCEYLSTNTDLEALLKSAEMIIDLVPYIQKINKSDIEALRKNKKYCNDEKLAESGHSALMLTEIPPVSLSQDELNIYTMIAKQFIAAFLPPLVENKTVITVEIDDCEFKSNGKTLVSKGFTELLPRDIKETALPELQEGQEIHIERFDIDEKVSQKPSRFTDADLIAIMESPEKYLRNPELAKNLEGKLKIGTEATRAYEISDICGKSGYAEKKTRSGKAEVIYATTKALRLIEQIEHFDITAVDMTAELGYMMEQIKSGTLRSEQCYENIKQYVKEQIEIIKSSDMKVIPKKKVIGQCPKCGGSLLFGEKGVYCSNWKEKNCEVKFARTILGATFTEKDVEKLLNGAIITKTMTKEGRAWNQRMKLNEEFKIEFLKNTDILPRCRCPKCLSNIKVSDKYYMCENYKTSCDFLLSKTFKGADITSNDVQELLRNKGKVEKEMKNKEGKLFKGHLSIEDGKLKISYE